MRPLDQEGADGRAESDGNGEDAEVNADDGFIAAHRRLGEGRKQRENDGAEHPEQAEHDAGAPQAGVVPEFLHEMTRRTQDVGVDAELRGGFSGARDEAAGGVGEGGDRQHGDGESLDAAHVGSESAGDGAEQDGDEGRAFDHGVAGREFVCGEMVRQDAVFERTEQRRDHAEQKEGDKEDRNGLGGETGHRDPSRARIPPA